MAEVRAGEQDLRHRMIVLGEQLIVGVHQLALPHGGGRLLGGDVGGATGQGQLAHPHTDGAGGNQHQLMAGVFEIAHHLTQLLHPPNIQQSGGVRQRGGAYFHYDTHRNPLLWLREMIILLL